MKNPSSFRRDRSEGVWTASLGVQVLLELRWSDLALHARGGHVHPGRPEDGVQDELAEVRVAPVLVIVSAGEAEAAPAVGSLDGPGEDLVPSPGLDDVLVRPAGGCRNAPPRVIV